MFNRTRSDQNPIKWIFMHENDTKHAFKIVQSWLNYRNAEIFNGSE